MMNKRIFEALKSRKMLDILPDRLFLKIAFHALMGKPLNLRRPRTFNEKLQWLKLYERKPEYTMMVDKYRVREYIKERLGEEYLIPLLGVWDDPDEIDFDALPEQFVLKCNHNSGLGMCICKDKSRLDIPRVKAELWKGLAQNYYLTGREWPYKNVPRKIVGEQFMTDGDTDGLTDYKFMCFNGAVMCSFVNTDRFNGRGLKIDFMDKEWNRLPFRWHYPCSHAFVKKPESYETMIAFAEKLAQDIPFARIDFYEVGGKPYFGEITFFPGGGYEEFTPEEWDNTLGSWLNLPLKNV